jgi:hypothetical protein
MAKGYEVLTMLRPNGGWVIKEDDYNSIQWIDCEPVTENDFEEGFALYDSWKSQKEAEQVSAKATAESKLEALGLTVEDIKALLS